MRETVTVTITNPRSPRLYIRGQLFLNGKAEVSPNIAASLAFRNYLNFHYPGTKIGDAVVPQRGVTAIRDPEAKKKAQAGNKQESYGLEDSCLPRDVLEKLLAKNIKTLEDMLKQKQIALRSLLKVNQEQLKSLYELAKTRKS